MAAKSKLRPETQNETLRFMVEPACRGSITPLSHGLGWPDHALSRWQVGVVSSGLEKATKRSEVAGMQSWTEYNAPMQKMVRISLQWGPAVVIMAVIFALSSRTAGELPDFGSWDYAVKKTGHILGYGLLGLACWRGLRMDRRRLLSAWVLAVIYAASDEFHQSFVAGRHPSIVDVLLFDGGGAALALVLAARAWHRRGEVDPYSNSRSNSSSSPQS